MKVSYVCMYPLSCICVSFQLRDILYWMEDILSTQSPCKNVEKEGDKKVGVAGEDSCMDAKQAFSAAAATVSPLTESEASADLTSSSQGNENSGHPKDCLPYWFESPDSSSSFIIHFQAPPDRFAHLYTTVCMYVCMYVYVVSTAV